MDRSSRQRRRRCSTISGNQTRCASPAATAHHLRLVPSRRVGVRRQIAVRTYLTGRRSVLDRGFQVELSPLQSTRALRLHRPLRGRHAVHRVCARPTCAERAHNSGRGAKYTAGRRPVRLVYQEAFRSVGKALAREYVLKQLTRAQKDALVVSGRRRHH